MEAYSMATVFTLNKSKLEYIFLLWVICQSPTNKAS